MKTRELIRVLEEADPSGDLECCVRNRDINFVDVVPASYDGTLEILRRSARNGKVLAGTLTTSGKKVRIHPLGIEEIIYDKPEFEVAIDVHDKALHARLESEVEAWRSEARE